MRKTRWGRGRLGPRAVLSMGAVLAVALASGNGLSAQDRTPRTERSDCRCVDRDGKAIPNCSCWRSLSGPNGMAVIGLSGARGARLGVTVSSEQEADADTRGARLESVTPDGPAAEAGLREGDIITRIDGKSLLAPLGGDAERDFDLDRSVPVQRLLAITSDLEPGQEVKVEYLRDGDTHTATVKARDLGAWGPRVLDLGGAQGMAERMRALGDRMREMRRTAPDGSRTFGLRGPEGGTFRMWTDSTGGGPHLQMGRWFGADLGLDLVEMNPGLGSYFGTSDGVLVTRVDDDGTLGLQAGDVVLSVGDRKVSDPDHLRRILRSYDPDETVTLHVMRDKRETTVTGHVGG